MSKKNNKRRTPVVLSTALGFLSIIYLAHRATNPTPLVSGCLQLEIIAVTILGIFGTIFAAIAGSLGWFPHSDTRRRHLADLAHESAYVFRPFIIDLFHSLLSRPAVGVIGILVSILITLFILTFRTGNAESSEFVGLGLGVAGLLFGMLGYHVALRVEKSIRDSISDFREFLKVSSNIIEEEILCENSRIKKFPEEQNTEGHPTKIPDLILVLWFPYYRLTKDFNEVGQRLTSQLKHIQELACRTYLITSENPMSLMLHFDNQYSDTGKRYCSDTLKRIASSLSGKKYSDWDSIIETEKTKEHPINVGDEKTEKVLDCVKSIKDLISPALTRYWTSKLINNDELMNGLVQIVWTPKKAALAFMPPDKITHKTVQTIHEQSAELLKDEQHLAETADHTKHDELNAPKQCQLIPGDRKPYKCSGFVTEDPFMISMIRDLIEIRFDI